jgi:hypothetical protein
VGFSLYGLYRTERSKLPLHLQSRGEKVAGRKSTRVCSVRNVVVNSGYRDNEDKKKALEAEELR